MKDIQQLTQEAIQKITDILKSGGTGYDPVRKEVSTTTGMVAYNLEPVARLLVPAYSPLRNRIPRVANTKGGTAVNWKVITGLDTAKSAIFTAEGVKASKVAITVSDKSGAFKTISLGDEVTFKSQWAGRTFDDVKARAIQRLLKTGIIREEQGIIGGRNAALPAVTAPTLVLGVGTVAAGTYNVFCRAIGFMPGSGVTAKGRFSAATSTGALAGGDDSIAASVPYVEGASRYEWYVGTAGNEKLEATTRINSVLLTSLAGTGVTKVAVDAADTGNGGDSTAFNGLYAQLDSSANVAKTLATGTPGTGTQLALNDLDDVLQDMWDLYKTDPDVISVNSEESIKITSLVLAANGGPTLYVTKDPGQKDGLTGGYRVTHYLSKVTGKAIPIETHPYQEQGTIGIFTFEMPFSASDIDNPIEIETLQEWMQIDYPPTRPAWDFEVLVDEVVKMYFPGANAVIRNIAPRT